MSYRRETTKIYASICLWLNLSCYLILRRPCRSYLVMKALCRVRLSSWLSIKNHDNRAFSIFSKGWVAFHWVRKRKVPFLYYFYEQEWINRLNNFYLYPSEKHLVWSFGFILLYVKCYRSLLSFMLEITAMRSYYSNPSEG